MGIKIKKEYREGQNASAYDVALNIMEFVPKHLLGKTPLGEPVITEDFDIILEIKIKRHEAKIIKETSQTC